MSVPPQQKPNAKRTGKRISFFNEQGVAMKEPVVQPAEAGFFGLMPPPSEQRPGEAGGVPASGAEGPNLYVNSVIFSPDKGGEQSRGHYQHTVPMKWPHQEAPQQTAWPQGISIPSWSQGYPQYLGVGLGDARGGQAAFLKPINEKQQLPNPADRDVAKARAMDWEQQQQQQQQQQNVAAMQHAHAQAYQQGQKPAVLQSQPHASAHVAPGSVLQPFQVAFGQPRPPLSSDYYQVFQSNRTLPNMNYTAQPKAQHQLQLQQQQQQLQQQQRQQQQQQQQQQQRQLQQQQLQQQQQQQQLQQQQLQQQQQQLQQQQQQQLQQQQQQQQQQQNQQQQQQHPQQQHQLQPHPAQIQHPNQHFPNFFQSTHLLHDNPHVQQPPPQALGPPAPPQGPSVQVPVDPPEAEPQKFPSGPQQPPDAPQPAPRRSRRLSKEGGVPPSGDGPFLAPMSQPGQGPQNGGPEGRGAPANEDVQTAATGVIQSTRRKRRASQEVNLETLAQKASEMESLPPQVVKPEPGEIWMPGGTAAAPGRGAGEREGVSAKRSRDDLLPLVIPVSVPVRRADHPSPDREQADPLGAWPARPAGLPGLGQPEHKPSVIVTRRRSLRNSLSESSGLNGGGEGGKDDDGKKSKRRPRPEPLFIPPPKPGTFIVPPVYSSITPYQSHLRSPVRLADNPLTMPPYTPPPILSPVREGSGLYFSTFLSSAAAAAAAANSQGLPPPATPKSATRSLLRSNSCDITPPVLSAMGEATPVSIEPRINIGTRYQAEVPELRDRSAAQQDQHLAEIVWTPLPELESKPAQQERVNDLMNLACSSALCGGGTNQELALHCLYECKGDILGALALLLLKKPIFSKTHPLGNYHYSGSDAWTPAEKRYFNKGISAYKKDFFMVQKVVRTKTVAQCVEFYYTYKKQVKIGRNGTLIYGDTEPPEAKATEAEVDVKSSQRYETRKEEDADQKWDGPCDRKQNSSPPRVTQTLQASENVRRGGGGGVCGWGRGRQITVLYNLKKSCLILRYININCLRNAVSENSPADTRAASLRVFFKVKSRSAHMKSHAEQEKKAAALRLKEAEERAAAEAAAAAAVAAAAAAAAEEEEEEEEARQNGEKEQGEESSDESSEEGEDVDDEDWH
ncbi:mitotic deacetylase-associated SANT domain protein [Anguilla rostrata]|uniref:mitotic deacetylase-associated SANT domain protein n=1 Tax=Anguilla rostrata TaxID=7938 RepID=UPI0030CE4DD2